MTAEQDDGRIRRSETDGASAEMAGACPGVRGIGNERAAYASEHGFPVRAMYDTKKVLVRKGVLPHSGALKRGSVVR